ncbi:MAG: response regulator transcription factor [Pseudomonadales bacterium]|nr:response regulator transcription factor [Pseudomonadales bacterium]
MENYTIALVEDHLETRQRLRRMIDAHDQLSVVGEACNLAEGQDLLKTGPVDVLLVDIGLPDGSGIDLICSAAKQAPNTEIMVVTVFGDERNVISAIEAGASGYLLKDGSNDYICDAILQIMAGGSPISPNIARHILTRFKQPSAESEAIPPDIPEEEKPQLTPRELDVLKLISKGFRYEEIGDILEISYHTVTSHIKQIYRKLSVHSRGEAVFEATRLGIVR